MKGIGVIYPQFSMQPKIQHKFIAQLSILETHFCWASKLVQNHYLSHPFLMGHY
jgi:hypothetical protein